MKSMIVFCLVASFCSLSLASSRGLVATGEVSVFNAARSYEVSLEGKAAQKPYEAMRASVRVNRDWTIKYGNGLTCGKSTKGEYACSFNIDQDGLLN